MQKKKAHAKQPERNKNILSSPPPKVRFCSAVFAKGGSGHRSPLPSAVTGHHNHVHLQSGTSTNIWLPLSTVVGCLVSPSSLVSARHYQHKGQSYTEKTFLEFMPNVILFLCGVCPKQTKTNLLQSLAVLEINIPFSISANSKGRSMQQVQPSGCREPWSVRSPGQSTGHPASELGTSWPRYPRAKFTTLSETKVSLEFLPRAWKKTHQAQMFQTKDSGLRPAFFSRTWFYEKISNKILRSNTTGVISEQCDLRCQKTYLIVPLHFDASRFILRYLFSKYVIYSLRAKVFLIKLCWERVKRNLVCFHVQDLYYCHTGGLF